MDNGDEIDATLMQVSTSVTPPLSTYAYSKPYDSKEDAFPATQCVQVGRLV